jgi:hypothetical protein
MAKMEGDVKGRVKVNLGTNGSRSTGRSGGSEGLQTTKMNTPL